jgi:hypothetical protein
VPGLFFLLFVFIVLAFYFLTSFSCLLVIDLSCCGSIGRFEHLDTWVAIFRRTVVHETSIWDAGGEVDDGGAGVNTPKKMHGLR